MTKVLFLTTLGLSIETEHIFTQKVWAHLVQHVFFLGYQTHFSLLLASVLPSKNGETYSEENITQEGIVYHKLYLNFEKPKDYWVSYIKLFFQKLAPDVIHTNVAEGYDVKAANELNIPICLTIHVGGVICPRSQVRGFLYYDDSLCSIPVGKQCEKCILADLPYPKVSSFLYHLMPKAILQILSKKIQKNIFYLAPFLNVYRNPINAKERIQDLQYAHIIAANRKLVELLKLNGLSNRVHFIPHGVEDRARLDLPKVHDRIKFFYLGRIEYAKGLHILLKALDGVDPNRYELHIYGKSGSSRKGQRYMKACRILSEDKNVVFHGWLPNDKLETEIKKMHVMILPSICLEVYGISAAESMAMGRPVIASRCGGGEIQVIDNVNGWLVDSNSVDELRNVIMNLTSNPHLVEEASINCKVPHPIDEYCHHLLDLYTEIALKNK